MKDIVKVVFFLLVIALMIAFLVWMDEDCRSRGGVYLSREGKCVEGLRELR